MAAVITPTIQPIDPIKTTATQASSYQAPKIGAANEQAVQSSQTMQGQLSGILSAGSPLLEQAKTRALQGMNARGLMNSSMAIGAGESAMYDAALPIAQFDASRYSDVANRNQDVGNQFKTQQFAADADATKTSAAFAQDAGLFNAGEANKASLTDAQIGANANLRQAEIGLDASKANASIDAQRENLQTEVGAQKDRLAMEITSREAISKLDNDTRQKMAEIEAGYKVQMQSQDSAARLFDQISVQMSQIALNKDLTPEAKRNATTMLMGQLTNGLNILGSVANLNLSSILNFDGMGKSFDTFAVDRLTLDNTAPAQQPAPATGGIIATPPASGQPAAPVATTPTSPAAPSAGNASAGQTHSNNLLSITQMQPVRKDFFTTEYSRGIQEGLNPEQAYREAARLEFDPEYQRAAIPNVPMPRFSIGGGRERAVAQNLAIDKEFEYLISQGSTPLEAATAIRSRLQQEEKDRAANQTAPAGPDYGGGATGGGDGGGDGGAV